MDFFTNGQFFSLSHFFNQTLGTTTNILGPIGQYKKGETYYEFWILGPIEMQLWMTIRLVNLANLAFDYFQQIS